MGLRTRLLTAASIALSATFYASAVAYAAGGYVITVGGPSDGLGHLVTFANLSANTHAGQTITFTGTDENGRPQTEALTGPAGSATITTTKYFQTLTSVTASATTGADTFNIGFTAGSAAAWIDLHDTRSTVANFGLYVTVVAGSPTFTVSYTYDAITWTAITALSAKTASTEGALTVMAPILRLTFTAAGTVTLAVNEIQGQLGSK